MVFLGFRQAQALSILLTLNLILVHIGSAIAASTTSIVESEGNKYLVSDKIVATIDKDAAISYGSTKITSNAGGLSAITIINAPESGVLSSKWLADTFSYMSSSDDVFGPLFLDHVLFKLTLKIQQPPSFPKDCIEYLNSYGAKGYSYLSTDNSIPSGPYFLRNAGILQAMRLYPDPYEAFMYGVIQSGNGSFNRISTDLIPVPSRLYTSSNKASLPLAGKRVAIKDIIDLQGVPTSASSKAYAAYHGPSNRTAPAVQRLLDLGATIIGKTKTTQFATGETARDWIEFQCPFNPRADGYLDPAGSSTGSAAAVAGYEWVDFAIGTDTCGSIIWPAALQGVFGLRPTLGVSELEGVMPASSAMDTIGFFARNITDFQLFQKVWYGKHETQAKEISRVIFPKGVFDSLSKNKKAIMVQFVEDARKSLSLSKSEVDIDTIWRSYEATAGNTSYADYLYSTVAHIQIWDSYIHESRFYNGYKERFGKYPYINPMVMHKWGIVRERISASDYKEARRRMATFGTFLKTQILKDDTIMVLPAGGAEPMYRDELISPENIDVYLQSFGFDNAFYSFLGGLPAVIIPVGQRTVTSKITKQKVMEPVSMMIVGPAGSEARIIDLVRKVVLKSGRPLGVKVGDNVF